MQQQAQDILAECAAGAGLSPCLEPFSREGSLADRLALRPFLMAPMAGVSNAAWRMMARAGGAALAYSEMVSVAGIHFGGEKTWDLVVPHAPEPDIAVQLFGSQPEQFREAAEKVVLRLGATLALLDINMACPVPKVVRKGEGSKLMEDSERAADIVCACRDGVAAGARELGIPEVPVTCKIRRGFREGRELAPEFAAVLEAAGASAIAVHGRFADQLYRGKADWGVINRVCAATGVPVIASGDILTAQDAVRVLRETGATAAMVARGSYGDPWVFSDAMALLAGQTPAGHPFDQRLNAFRCHVRLMGATGSHVARARSLAGWYFKGIPDAALWRDRAMRCSKVEEFLELADVIEAHVADAGEA